MAGPRRTPPGRWRAYPRAHPTSMGTHRRRHYPTDTDHDPTLPRGAVGAVQGRGEVTFRTRGRTGKRRKARRIEEKRGRKRKKEEERLGKKEERAGKRRVVTFKMVSESRIIV